MPPTIKPEELQLLDEFITERFGLHFADHRRDVLIGRLGQRVDNLRLRSFMDYYLLLQFQLNGELPHLTRMLTNNETYFFREVHQFETLFGPGLDALRGHDGKLPTLKLLCAGCSSGEEPYTLSIYAGENRHRMWGTEVTIDAFDIDEDRVAMARAAEYGRASLRSTTEEQRRSYFVEVGADRHRVKPMVKQSVRLSRGNIVDPATFPRGGPYDAVFCRNVLIYFSEPSLRRAIASFAQAVRPGGLLFLGHSESIIGLCKEFEPVRLGEHIVYRRERT